MDKFECKDCGSVYNSLKGLGTHKLLKHSIQPRDTYIENVLEGVTPECNCGCGEEPKFLSITRGYREYVRGHAARVNNNWGHNPDALKKSHETQKKMYETGELQIWNKGLTIDDPRVKNNIDKVMSNPERGDNISKTLSNTPKSNEHKLKISKAAKIRWSDPKEREKQRYRKIKWFKNKKFNKKSKLEQFFEDKLTELNIGFENQFPLNGYLYDFYIPSKNTLIEVDGDWFHCNPNIHPKPLSPIQENTVKNDKIKNQLAKDNNINLIRIWEYDINNNLDDVINKLKLKLLT